MKFRYFIVLLSLALPGCSLMYSYSDNLPQRIDSWVTEKKYNVALNTIDYIKPTHKDYTILQRKKKSILRKMDSYEKEAIEKSSALANQGLWIAALEESDAAAKNVTDPKNIIQHRANLLAKRNQIISAYENELLTRQAVDLISKTELYEKIKKTVSENENNELGISDFDQLRYDTSLKLADKSERHYKNGNYSKANEAILLALKLNPDKHTAIRLNEIKKSVNKETKLKTLSYAAEAKALLKKLSQGYSHEILKDTKDKLALLNNNVDNQKTYSDLIAKLKKHLAAGVKQRFEAGRKSYSEGKTQEALSIWQELNELDPEHPKLQSHIKRAEKILNKLDKLTNKPINKK